MAFWGEPSRHLPLPQFQPTRCTPAFGWIQSLLWLPACPVHPVSYRFPGLVQLLRPHLCFPHSVFKSIYRGHSRHSKRVLMAWIIQTCPLNPSGSLCMALMRVSVSLYLGGSWEDPGGASLPDDARVSPAPFSPPLFPKALSRPAGADLTSGKGVGGSPEVRDHRLAG